MIKLASLLEGVKFTNWVKPSATDLKREFRVEHELKGLDYFDSEKSFLAACKAGKVISITKSMDANINYRSGTTSFKELLSLIKTYRSYPTYRNEDTLKDIYKSFKENGSMDLPIVLTDKRGNMRVFSGNTRLDIAFQLGITPKALVININGKHL